MSKINSFLIIFSLSFIILFSLFWLLFVKSLKLFIIQFLNFCQSFLLRGDNFSLQNIINLTFFVVLILVFSLFLKNLFKVMNQHRIFKKNLKKSIDLSPRLKEFLAHEGLENKIFLIESKELFAFCYGFIRPKIFMSKSLFKRLNNKELKAVLKHEKYHLENKDSLTMLFAFLARPLFIFLPLMQDLTKYYKLKREISADKEANESYINGNVILGTIKKFLNESLQQPLVASSIYENSVLKLRVNSLLNKETKFNKFTKLNFLISCASFIIILTFLIIPLSSTHAKSLNQCNKPILNQINFSGPFSPVK